MDKWEDFFEIQWRPHYFGRDEEKRQYYLISKLEGFGNWSTYKEHWHALIAAKAKFRHMQKQIEKELLGG